MPLRNLRHADSRGAKPLDPHELTRDGTVIRRPSKTLHHGHVSWPCWSMNRSLSHDETCGLFDRPPTAELGRPTNTGRHLVQWAPLP